MEDHHHKRKKRKFFIKQNHQRKAAQCKKAKAKPCMKCMDINCTQKSECGKLFCK